MEAEPATAYDLWSLQYDNQPGNLMLVLDEQLFSRLMDQVDLNHKTIVDIGCGTGRHWKKIFERHPSRLAGYDVSAGMLEVLKQKFPSAETHLLKDNNLSGSADGSTDIIVSTLTIAHIENIEDALKEWKRVLKEKGDMIITDYHPAALAKGGNRTFKYNDKIVAVKNHIHSIERIKELAKQLGFEIIRFEEILIDETMRSFYENKNALPLFEKFKGTPIIFGIHLRKK